MLQPIGRPGRADVRAPSVSIIAAASLRFNPGALCHWQRRMVCWAAAMRPFRACTHEHRHASCTCRCRVNNRVPALFIGHAAGLAWPCMHGCSWCAHASTALRTWHMHAGTDTRSCTCMSSWPAMDMAIQLPDSAERLGSGETSRQTASLLATSSGRLQQSHPTTNHQPRATLTTHPHTTQSLSLLR